VVVTISHSPDSWLLYVHPPLAVIGYILTFTLLFAIARYWKDDTYKSIVGKVGWAAWTFTFLGLVTGMIWAQIAWGRPFGFDPKETLTLLIFLSVGLNMYLFHRGIEKSIILVNGVLSCILIILTIAVPLLIYSLHGYS
jgi:ABC-type transport system involved in cytochrome c biogenesis permease subunit